MFASDDFARGNSFMGYTVGKLRDVQAVYDDFIIVLAFAVRDLPPSSASAPLFAAVRAGGSRRCRWQGWSCSTWNLSAATSRFLQVEQLFADEQSRKGAARYGQL